MIPRTTAWRIPTHWEKTSEIGQNFKASQIAAWFNVTLFKVDWNEINVKPTVRWTDFIWTEQSPNRQKEYAALYVTISNYSSFGLEFPTHTLRVARSRLSAIAASADAVTAAAAGLHAW